MLQEPFSRCEVSLKRKNLANAKTLSIDIQAEMSSFQILHSDVITLSKFDENSPNKLTIRKSLTRLN